MKTLTEISRAAALTLCLAIAATVSYAQGYYDDDIYFDASKAKTEKKKTSEKTTGRASEQQYQGQYYYDGAQYVPWNNVGDYQAADAYQVTGTSTRDVDEYNRRTPTSQSHEIPDSITLGQFEEMTNTRNLARFHNSAEARQAYAENLEASGYDDGYGYAPASTQTVINLNVVDPFYSYPYYPYYGVYWSRPWYWNSWGYDPWYWGPSWSYGPSWSWSWGWGGPSWGWGGPHPGWHHPGWAPAPPRYTSSGAYAPNSTRRPGNTGTYRPNGTGRFNSGNSAAGTRGSAASSLGTRPAYRTGNVGSAVNRGSATTTERSGYKSPTYTPNGSTQSTGVTRGRTAGTREQSAPRQTTTPSYNQNRNTNSYNSGSYNSGASRGRSTGSFGGGSRGSSSGASRSSGGHRGR